MLSVAWLYCLQNSMVWTPCGPSAVPTGGAGVAAPAGSWILTIAVTRLRAMGLLLSTRCWLYQSLASWWWVRDAGRPVSLSGAAACSELGDLAEFELDRGLAAE